MCYIKWQGDKFLRRPVFVYFWMGFSWMTHHKGISSWRCPMAIIHQLTGLTLTQARCSRSIHAVNHRQYNRLKSTAIHARVEDHIWRVFCHGYLKPGSTRQSFYIQKVDCGGRQRCTCRHVPRITSTGWNRLLRCSDWLSQPSQMDNRNDVGKHLLHILYRI